MEKGPLEVATNAGTTFNEVLILRHYHVAYGVGLVSPEGGGTKQIVREYLGKPEIYKTSKPLTKGVEPTVALLLGLLTFVGRVVNLDGVIAITPYYRSVYCDGYCLDSDDTSPIGRHLKVVPYEGNATSETLIAFIESKKKKVQGDTCRLFGFSPSCNLELSLMPWERRLIVDYLRGKSRKGIGR